MWERVGSRTRTTPGRARVRQGLLGAQCRLACWRRPRRTTRTARASSRCRRARRPSSSPVQEVPVRRPVKSIGARVRTSGCAERFSVAIGSSRARHHQARGVNRLKSKPGWAPWSSLASNAACARRGRAQRVGAAQPGAGAPTLSDALVRFVPTPGGGHVRVAGWRQFE